MLKLKEQAISFVVENGNSFVCTCNFRCGRRSCCLLHVQWNLVC